MLSDGRRYLFNTKRPTAADITFAALSQIIVAPPELQLVVSTAEAPLHLHT